MLIDRAQNRPIIVLLGSVGVTVTNCGIALMGMVVRVVTHPGGGIGRLLNSQPAIWLGKINYSLYLWQMPFLNPEVSRVGLLSFQ